jgi:hypothetical protein
MLARSQSGSHILAEYTAVLMVILLALTFPLVNLATFSYRYNMLVAAAHAAAHAGAVAPTFSGNVTGVAAVVPATVNTLLRNAGGISNVSYQYRINETDINSQNVIHHGWGRPLPRPASETSVFTIEVAVTADVAPLVPMQSFGLIPTVRGLTSPARDTVSAQEMAENVMGLNR